MTCRGRLMLEHPEFVDGSYDGGCYGCPSHYGYLEDPVTCDVVTFSDCEACWNREIPENGPELINIDIKINSSLGSFDKFDRIIINGIRYVKEKENENC